MALEDYSAAWGNPMKAMTEGNAYVNSLFDRATKVGDDNAKTQAGQAFGRGDYTGAATTLANTGDISGAATVQDYALKQFQARHALLQQAVPVLSGILAKGGPKAVSDAFEQIAPTLQQSGLDAPSIDRVRQGLATNPEQMLQVLGIGAKKNLQYKQDANGQWLVIDGDTGSVVQTLGSPKPFERDPHKQLYLPDQTGGGATPAAAGGLTPALPGAAPAAPAAGAGSPPVPPTGTDAAAAVPPGYAARVATNESGGNPGAQNPLSSATGNGQFISSTWLSLIRQSHPELAGMSDSALLALRNNPALSNDMIEQYAAINGKALNQAGLPVNAATLYLAHGFGSQGAITLLKSDPNAPVSSVMPGNVIAANPYLQKMTVGQLLQRFASKMGGPTVAPAAPAAPAGSPPTPAAAPTIPGYRLAADAKPTTQYIQPNSPESAAYGGLGGNLDTVTGKFDPDASGLQGTDPKVQAAIVSGKTGDAFLKALPDAYARRVKGYADGSFKPPGDWVTRTPAGQQLINAITAYNPSFQGTEYSQKQGAVRAFVTGPASKQIDSINRASQHLVDLRQLALALKNGDNQTANYVRNRIKEWSGSADPTNVSAITNLAAGEIANMTIGGGASGGGTGADRERALASAPGISSSPAQIAGWFDKVIYPMARANMNTMHQRWVSNRLPDAEFPNHLQDAARQIWSGNRPGQAGAPQKIGRFLVTPG